MKIHCFQHAEAEGPGQIGRWAAARGHEFSTTHWYRGETAAKVSEIDFLVIMGGAMNVYEYRNHPWLRTEKAAMRAAIEQGLPVLGICLGAQLIADVTGGKVYQNPEIELGWFPVQMLPPARSAPGFTHFPEELIPLHWHGDTFDLPPGATRLASSAQCLNQAFVIGSRVVGLQFHPEVMAENVRAFIGSEALPQGRYVQSVEQIVGGDKHLHAVHRALDGLLDYLAAGA